ncbi:EAL domain-containing protein [Salinarimonas ramus]|uniref:Diguanylate phosphodiesterase n=1 Tax=Salinarimonas ramus TaxID=690164 RepID=A0A917V4T2_9HYPH|nr:EAL domain-containing protein [Salinarimonas ramus]GGK36731.1 diguanylate phosphodiesterase [Salinarimonas ramus]
MERRRPRANERRRAPGAALAAGIAALGAALLALAGAIAAGAGVALAMALTLAAAGLALAGGALVLARRARTTAEKASSDLDFLARRLLRVESRLAEAERRKGGDEDVRGAVAEVSGEIALISGLLRDIAGTVAGHDRTLTEIIEAQAALAQDESPEPERYEPLRGAPPPPPAPEPAAWAPPPRFAPVLEPEPEFDPLPEPDHLPEPEPAPAPRVFTPQPLHRAAHEPLFEEEVAPPAPEPALDRYAQAVLRALREDRMEIHLQPVVSLPQRKTRFYEALARLRLDDDSLVMPDAFLPAITRAGLTAELDGKVAARAAAIARHLVNRGSDAFVTLDLAQESLVAPGFLRALGRILEAYPDVAGRLAFEIAQRSWRMLDAEASGALDALRSKGALFVLDRASDLRVDALGLADRGVRYVKLPSALILGHAERPAPGLDVAVSDLSAVLSRAGIKLVAEAVEREEDVPDLIDLDVPLAQGLVFGGPRAVRSDLIGGPPPGRGGEPAGTRPRTQDGGAPTARAVPPRAPAPAPGISARYADDPPPQEPKRPYRATLRRAG